LNFSLFLGLFYLASVLAGVFLGLGLARFLELRNKKKRKIIKSKRLINISEIRKRWK